MDFDVAAIEAGLTGVWALVLSYSLSVVGAVVLMIAGWLVAGLIERWLVAGLSNIRGIDVTLARFFASIARYAILILVVVMVLGQFGVQTASIIAAIGAIGLAIGLALQGTLRNIAAGIMLLVLRPFRIGESIVVGNVDGDVEEIGLFATRLRASDGTYILAPNAKLWNEPVRNTSRNRMRRYDITVTLDYTVDVDLAQTIMLDLAKADQRIKKQPPPMAFVGELRETGLALTLRYWTSDKDFLRTRIDLNKAIKRGFDAKGIAFPSPPQEVVLKNLPGEARASGQTRQ